jgi:lysophospholipase L1-like esterase
MNMVRAILIRLSLVVMGLVAPLLILEVGLRIEHLWRKGTPLTVNPSSKWDDTLGWTGKEHRFEPISANPILVIGDSFTDGLDVPSEQMWFAELARRYPERGVVAYGGLGYGTLQQLLVLQRYRSQGLTPSLVILQLCSNDILNNYFELEKDSLLQRAPGPRPYLEGDSVNMRFPRDHAWLVYPLVSISRFAYRTSTRWGTRLAEQARAGKANSIEFEIQAKGFSFKPFIESTRVTHTLLERFKLESGNTALAFVLVDDIEPYTAALGTSARKLSIPLLIAPRFTNLTTADRLPDGTHLSARGNLLLGETVAEFVKEQRLLP